MNANSFVQCAVYMIVLLALAKPLGIYMARVYHGNVKWLRPIESFIYRICGIKTDDEMDWKNYAATMMMFNIVGLFAVYLLQRCQDFLPLNPTAMKAVSPDSSFNTATSFATNTNWQGYSGELTMSYLTQMLGLTVQNFVSAAAGMGVYPPLAALNVMGLKSPESAILSAVIFNAIIIVLLIPLAAIFAGYVSFHTILACILIP